MESDNLKKNAGSIVFNGKMPISRMIDQSLSLCFRQWRLFLLPALLYGLVITSFNYLTSPGISEQLDFMKNLMGGADGGLNADSIQEVLLSNYSSDIVSGPISSILSVFLLGIMAAFFTYAIKLLNDRNRLSIFEVLNALKSDLKIIVVTTAMWILFFGLLAVIAFPLALLPMLIAWGLSLPLFFSIFLSFISISAALCLVVIFFARLLLVPMVVADTNISGREALKKSWSITATLKNQPVMERPVTRLTVLLTVVTLVTAFLKSFGSTPTDIGYMGLVSQMGSSLMQGGVMDVSSVLEQLAPPSASAIVAAFILQVLLEALSTAFILSALTLFYFDLKARLELSDKTRSIVFSTGQGLT